MIKHIHIRHFLLLTLLGPLSLLSQPPIYDSGGPLLPEQAAYDVAYYELDLQIFPEEKRIEGSLAMMIKILEDMEAVVMNLDTLLKVDSASIEGSPVKWERKNGLVYLYPNSHHPETKLKAQTAIIAKVWYGGQPLSAPIQRRGWSDGFFWDKTKGGQPWIGNVSVLNGADIWWPCKDHPSDEADSMALNIRVPENLTVAANGRLRGISDHQDGTKTHHWFVSTPINNYAVTVNVAPYRKIETQFQSVSGDRFPFVFYVLPKDFDKGQKQFTYFQQDMAFLEKMLGPYPFRTDKYGVAQTSYFGMETQSIIAYGSDFSLNKYGFDFLHFHELVHEWFANMVTAANWKDWWIHEGFATYMEALYAEELKGEAAYHEYVASFYKRIQNKAPLAPDGVYSTRQTYLPDVYAKGAVVLHMLRYLIGKEKLLLAIRRMAYPDPEMEKVSDGSHCRLSSSEEFQQIVEEIFGQDLDWFFDAYLKHKEPPVLVLTTESGSKAKIEWETESSYLFKMPVQISVNNRVQVIEMANGKGQIPIVKDLSIDPQSWILKKVLW